MWLWWRCPPSIIWLLCRKIPRCSWWEDQLSHGICVCKEVNAFFKIKPRAGRLNWSKKSSHVLSPSTHSTPPNKHLPIPKANTNLRKLQSPTTIDPGYPACILHNLRSPIPTQYYPTRFALDAHCPPVCGKEMPHNHIHYHQHQSLSSFQPLSFHSPGHASPQSFHHQPFPSRPAS